MPSNNLEKLAEAVLEGEDDEAWELTTKLVSDGATVEEVMQAIQKGLAESGERLEKKEYFVADIAMSGEAAKKVMEVLMPKIEKEQTTFAGTYIVGSAKTDVHDIGKNLVAAYLRGAGFHVIDLGVDVGAEAFVEAAKKHKAQIVGASAYNTSVADTQFPLVKKAFEDANYRDNVRLMLGGAGAYRDMVLQYGYDGFGRDAHDAVVETRKLIKGM